MRDEQNRTEHICGPDPATSATERQTDDMQSQYRALHSVGLSRGKTIRLVTVISLQLIALLTLNLNRPMLFAEV